jgi:hypothetical protein
VSRNRFITEGSKVKSPGRQEEQQTVVAAGTLCGVFMTHLTGGLATICVELGDTTFTRSQAGRDVYLCCVLESTPVLPRCSSGYDWLATPCGAVKLKVQKNGIFCVLQCILIKVCITAFIYVRDNTSLSPESDINNCVACCVVCCLFSLQSTAVIYACANSDCEMVL